MQALSPSPQLRDKYRGALLGVAIGDALGMATEGLSREEIVATFGEVREFSPRATASFLQPGQWTDDTQLTIALAEAILEGRGFNPQITAKRFVDWLLREHPRFAGMTCLTACQRLASGVPWDRAGDPNGAGCGSAMRAAPIGLLYPDDFDSLYRAAVIQSAITHRDPRAIAGSAAVAYGVARLLHGGSVEGFASEVAKFVEPLSPEMAERISLVEKLKTSPPESALSQTGTGGFVLETVPAAFYCFLSRPDDFEHAVVTAANAGGDTDSIGAIAGALSGAYNGASRIPQKFLKDLEAKEYIISLADQLFDLAFGI